MKPAPFVSGDYQLEHTAQGDDDTASDGDSGAPCLSFKVWVLPPVATIATFV